MASGWTPALGMVVVQVAYAILNILYKLTATDGMDLRVLVAYRHICGAAFLVLLSVILERRTWSALTGKILMQSFLCGLFGGTLTQNFYLVAIKLTTATFSTAMAILAPAVTFLLALLFRMEKLDAGKVTGKAKLAGTALGLGGAMLLTFYRGPDVTVWRSSIDLLKGHGGPEPTNLDSKNRVIGGLAAFVSCLCYSAWMILQRKISEKYPHVYTTSSLMCLTGAAQSTIYAFFLQKSWEEWKLGLDIRLFTVLFAGIVASGMITVVMTWCIRTKGPLFTSIFSPLMLVIVAVLGSFLLEEKLHLGSLLGSALIVVGLYSVLWGKSKEAESSRAGGSGDDAVAVVAGCEESDLTIHFERTEGYRENILRHY